MQALTSLWEKGPAFGHDSWYFSKGNCCWNASILFLPHGKKIGISGSYCCNSVHVLRIYSRKSRCSMWWLPAGRGEVWGLWWELFAATLGQGNGSTALPATCSSHTECEWARMAQQDSRMPAISGVLPTTRPCVTFLNYRVNCLGPCERKCISLMQFLFFANLFNPEDRETFFMHNNYDRILLPRHKEEVAYQL